MDGLTIIPSIIVTITIANFVLGRRIRKNSSLRYLQSHNKERMLNGNCMVDNMTLSTNSTKKTIILIRWLMCAHIRQKLVLNINVEFLQIKVPQSHFSFVCKCDWCKPNDYRWYVKVASIVLLIEFNCNWSKHYPLSKIRNCYLLLQNTQK